MDAVPTLAPAKGFRLNWRITPLRITAMLVLLALAVRLIGVATRPLWLDEAYSAWFSSRSWHVLWTEVPTYEPHPPFYYSLLKLWRGLFGGTATALRSFSLAWTAATVPLIIAASAELERQQPSGRPLLRAGIAAFLFACSPMLVLIGGEARPYPLLIFAYSLAALGVLRLTREFAEGGPGGWPSWVMLIVGAELGLWAHGLGLIYALCLGAALLPSWLRPPVARPRLVRGLAAATLVTLLYLPCLLMIMNRVGDWGTGWLSWRPFMILELLVLYSVPVEVLTIGSAVAALVMILLAKRAIQAELEARRWSSQSVILLLWWGPPILAILISQFAVPIFLARTLTPTLVPAYLALAGSLSRDRSSRERLLLSAALAITLLPTAVQVALRPGKEAWTDVAAYLKGNVQRGDEVWLYPNDSALPLREAGAAGAMLGIPGNYPAVGIMGPIRAGSPAVVSLTNEQANAVASNPSKRTVPIIWLVSRQAEIFDPKSELPAALARVRRPGPPAKWGSISVRPYYRR